MAQQTYTPAELAALKAQYEAGGVYETGLRAVGPKPGLFSWWPFAALARVSWQQISSRFGDRYNSVGVERTSWLWHLGVDWHLPVGTPIVAIADGDITAVIPETDPTSGPRGNTIIQTVEHGYALPTPGEIITASYTHLQGFNVSANQRVRRGDVIGSLGQSGPNVGRAHLHLNIMSSRGSAAINDPLTGPDSFRYRYDFLQLMSGDMTPISPVNPPLRKVPVAFIDHRGVIYPQSATVIWPFVCRTRGLWSLFA